VAQPDASGCAAVFFCGYRDQNLAFGSAPVGVGVDESYLGGLEHPVKPRGYRGDDRAGAGALAGRDGGGELCAAGAGA
jgi:hypothetical protein